MQFLFVGLLAWTAVGQVSVPQIPEMPAGVVPATSPATEPAVSTPASQPAAAALRYSWSADHASGVYFAKEEGRVSLLVDNMGNEALPFVGKIVFGRIEGAGFEPVSITPIAEATVKAKRRVKVEVPVTFGLPGRYGIKVNDELVPGVFDMGLEVRYPPPGEGDGEKTVSWVAAMPEQALVVEGFLGDFAQRTGVKRFVVQDDLKVQPPAFLKLMGEMRKAKVEVVWHLTLPVMEKVDAAVEGNLSRYVAGVMKEGKGVVRGIVLNPWKPGAADRRMEAAEYQACYAAVYKAAKEVDPQVAMLGTSWAAATRRLMLDEKGTLRPYLDGVATSGDAEDFLVATKKGEGELGFAAEKVWLLPGVEGKSGVPTAVALGAGLRNIAMPVGDLGVGVHVLGGAVLYGRIREAVPPYVTVFGGNGYAVAAIAGMGAGTPLDKEWAGLKGAEGTLEVHDENKEMRVVDSEGNTLERVTGDMFEVPLDGRMWYLLEAGSAEDVAAALRRAGSHGMPVAEVTGVKAVDGGIKLTVRSTQLDAHDGVVRVLEGEKEIGSKAVEGMEPGKAVEVGMDGMEGLLGKEVVLELTVGQATGRQQVVVK